MNVRLLVAYDGKNYHGWAEQPAVPTAQGKLRQALATLLHVSPASVEMQGASRTDAGVHSLGQVVSVVHDTDRVPWDFVRGLNGLTPLDISVWHAEEVHDDFNARHSSTGKRYRYRIWPHRFPDPLRRDQAWWVKHRLDVDAMRAAAPHLLGTHDFTSLRASDCGSLTTVRELTRVELEERNDEIVLWVEGTAFLKYMVRNIAGTLVDVGRGLIAPDSMPDVIDARDRTRAGRTAPPHGLTLMEVFYDDDPWQRPPRVGVDYRYAKADRPT